MATVEQPLIDRLLADSFLSHTVVDRISPQVRAQGDPLPAIVYEVVSDEHMGATLNGPATMHRITVDFRCYSDDYAQAKQIADAVRASLDGVAFAEVQWSAAERTDHTVEQLSDGTGDAPRSAAVTVHAWI